MRATEEAWNKFLASMIKKRCPNLSRQLLAVLGLSAIAVLTSEPGQAQTPAAICARVGTDDTPRAIPEALAPAVNATFGTDMPAALAVKTTVFRCADGHVLVCTAGANLPCGPANTSPTPGPGVVDWCRDNWDAAFIPAAVVGHDTIYAWRCQDGAPHIVRQIEEVDPRGFIARFWRVLG